MWGAALGKRYGRYDFSTSPAKVSPTLVALKDNQTVPLKAGRNILVTGAYKLIIKKKGFLELETNFFLTTKGLAHHFILEEKPFTLVAQLGQTPADIYLNGRLIAARQLASRLTISNLPPQRHALTIFYSAETFFYKSFHPQGKSELFIKAKPFYHYQKTLISVSLLGLVPGLNYFVHFPQSTIGLVIPNLVIHYFFVIGYVLQESGTTFIDEGGLAADRETIKNGLLAGLITASLLHAFFSFLGTKKDLDDIRKDYQKKLTWGFNLNLKQPLYGIKVNYRVK